MRCHAAVALAVLSAWPVNASRTVRIGYRDFWPLSYQVEGKRATGFVVDLFERAAVAEGSELDWVLEMGAGATAVRSGAVTLWPLNPSVDPEAEGLFRSDAWWRVGYQVLVRKDSRYETPEQLKGHTLAFHNYPTLSVTADRHVSGTTHKLYTSTPEAMAAFCRGEADSVLVGYFRTLSFLMDRPEPFRNVPIRVLNLPEASAGLTILSRPEDRALAEQIYRRIERFAGDGTMAQVVERYPEAAGGITLHMATAEKITYERRLALISLVVVGAGIVVCFLLWGRFSRDMARRRRAERLLNLQNQALEQATEGIAILDANGRFGYANRAFSTMHGYDDEQGLIGHGAEAVLFPESNSNSEQWIAAIISQGHYEGQTRHVRKDGTAFPMRVSASVLRDETGKLVGIILVGHDMTREARLEEQLRQSQRMEAVGRLAGGVAHDFNNYLTVILGYSELALSPATAEPVLRSSLAEIKAAGERAAELTRQLLAFGRKQIIRPVALDLNSVVQETANMLRRLLVSEVQIVVRLDPKLNRIKADVTQLQQVLLNLAVNAQHAMPEGGTLTVSTSNCELTEEMGELPSGRYSRILFSDTGVGMIPEVAERIFEPFFTTKEQGYGSGLGLAIVYGIVKQSQGHITVETTPGKGTTFQILWPQLQEPEERTEVPVRRQAVRGTETVLVVDDEPEVRALAGEILRQYGYRVTEAADYAQAESVAQKQSIDLLLTDVILPGRNGRQVANRLRVLQPSLRVLFMTGYNEDIIASRGVLNEGVAVVQKPFTPEDLAARVGEVLARA
jgi:PAS domain S-box-containing protein